MTLRRPAAWLAVALAVALVASCTGTGSGGSGAAPPTTGAAATAASACVENEQGTGCLPVAPDSARVDRAKPHFSDPTRITNARFPVGELTQVLQLGHESGRPLRVEVTRLPTTQTFTWDGQRVETVASQFTAFLGGRIREVAIDYFAQADDGSARWPSRSSRPPSTSSSATGRRTGSTWTASTCGRGGCWPTPPPRATGAVAGDVATLQVLWDRSGHRVAPATAKRVTAALAALRKAADGKDLPAAATAAAALRMALPAAAP